MRRLPVLVLFFALVVGCSRPAPVAVAPLTVAAASNLQSAFSDLGSQFEAKTSRKVIFTFGSSGTLAKQIESGAPIDLFAAASVDYVDALRQKSLIVPETETVYALGRVVLATANTAGPKLVDLKELLEPRIKKIAIANPEIAPYGLAAKQALQSAGIWDQVKAKLVFGENIRQTLQFIQTGNADAGIVSLSLADVPEIGWTLLPADLHRPLKQGLAVVKGSANKQAAREFAAFVTGPSGQTTLKKYGYASPEGP